MDDKLNNLFQTTQARLKRLLVDDPNLTGQVDIQIHLKEGEVKDVYFMNRSKVLLGTSTS